MNEEFYIGQIFEGMYPKKASDWANENNAQILEIDPVDGVRRFEIFEKPSPTPPTHEDMRIQRIMYRHEHIDDKTLERNRKLANGSWTEEDEAEYLALDAEVTAYIEEHLPYNDVESN